MTRPPLAGLRALVLLLSFAAAATAWAQWPYPAGGNGKPTLAPMLKEVTPAVVNIAVISRNRASRHPMFDDPFFRRFFNIPREQQDRLQRSAGSGVIVSVPGSSSLLTVTVTSCVPVWMPSVTFTVTS